MHLFLTITAHMVFASNARDAKPDNYIGELYLGKLRKPELLGSAFI